MDEVITAPTYTESALPQQGRAMEYFNELLRAVPGGAYICGGAASYMAGLNSTLDGDIDFYFFDEGCFQKMCDLLAEDKYAQLLGNSENATNYSILGRMVQLVHPRVASGTLVNVLNTFDINYARIGIYATEQGGLLMYKDDSIDDREIMVYKESIRHPVKTAYRLAKYARKFPNAKLRMDTFVSLMNFWTELPEEAQKQFLENCTFEYDES
jgi:hypothetical protein